MSREEIVQRPEWPREVLIRKTLDAIAAELGDDYNEDDDNGLVADAIMTSSQVIEIESWEEIPDGFEIVHEKDREACQVHLESKQRG